MDRSPRSDMDKADGPERFQGFVALLVLIVAALALAGGAGYAGLRQKIALAISGEDIVELGRREIQKSLEERKYWGALVAEVNPALTSFEVNEIGRAILQYSRHYSLPPQLLVAIIRVESSGRVNAVSPKGAQGLMQVMPFWKGELGIEGTLFDIDNNIRAGSHILAENIRERGFEDGIALYYRGNLPVSGAGYVGKVQKAMASIS